MEQGLHSAQHLGKAALGLETIARNELVAHAWVAAGAGLNQVFPHDGPVAAAQLNEEQRSRIVAANQQLEAGAIDWTAFVKTVLTILLQLLGCFLLILVIGSQAFAAAQAPCPPQAPVVQPVPVAAKPYKVYGFSDLHGGAFYIVSNRDYPLETDSRHFATREEAWAERDRLNSLKVTLSSPCSPACTCGCQDGAECRCVAPRQTQPAAAPYYFAPAFVPAYQSFSSRGCAGGG